RRRDLGTAFGDVEIGQKFFVRFALAAVALVARDRRHRQRDCDDRERALHRAATPARVTASTFVSNIAISAARPQRFSTQRRAAPRRGGRRVSECASEATMWTMPRA